jgi:hypothetical protein
MKPVNRLVTSALALGLAIAFWAPLPNAGARSSLTNVQPLPYECTDDDSGTFCVCKGVADCNQMRKDGVCGLPTPDLSCLPPGPKDVNRCWCDWVQNSVSPTTSFITKQNYQITPITKSRKVRSTRSR